MNKSKLPVTESPLENAYQIIKKDSGYYIIRQSYSNNRIVASQKMTEPDVLSITMSNLEKIIRREFGL